MVYIATSNRYLIMCVCKYIMMFFGVYEVVDYLKRKRKKLKYEKMVFLVKRFWSN